MAHSANEPLEQRLRKVARDLMEDLRIVLDEPELLDTPSELTAFPWLDAGWYYEQTRKLEALGYSVMRDIDGSPLRARCTHASMIRVMVSPDQRTTAGLYWIKPKASLFVILLLKVLGKWPKPAAIIELVSYTEACGVMTINLESPFLTPPGYDRLVVPNHTELRAQIAAHEARLPNAVQLLTSFEAVFARRRKQVDAQRAWRREVTVTSDELDRLLKPHGRNAARVRPYLEQELKEWQQAQHSKGKN